MAGSSQMTSSSSLSTVDRSSKNLKMRATVGKFNLNFTATNAVVADDTDNSFSWIPESHDQSFPGESVSGQAESSLLADLRAESSALGSRKPGSRITKGLSYQSRPVSERTQISQRSTSTLDRVRLLVLAKRDSNQEKAYFVKKAYDAAKERVKFSNENAIRKQNQVSMFRSYRVGEIPDIQIKHSDIVVPLLALAQNDPEICSFLFVELVRGVISCITSSTNSRYDRDQSKSLLDQLSNSFSFILSNSADCSNELLVKSILWIAEEHSESIHLETGKSVLCAVENCLELSAIAYLEKKLMTQPAGDEQNPEPVSKRRKLTNDGCGDTAIEVGKSFEIIMKFPIWKYNDLENFLVSRSEENLPIVSVFILSPCGVFEKFEPQFSLVRKTCSAMVITSRTLLGTATFVIKRHLFSFLKKRNLLSN